MTENPYNNAPVPENNELADKEAMVEYAAPAPNYAPEPNYPPPPPGYAAPQGNYYNQEAAYAAPAYPNQPPPPGYYAPPQNYGDQPPPGYYPNQQGQQQYYQYPVSQTSLDADNPQPDNKENGKQLKKAKTEKLKHECRPALWWGMLVCCIPFLGCFIWMCLAEKKCCCLDVKNRICEFIVACCVTFITSVIFINIVVV